MPGPEDDQSPPAVRGTPPVAQSSRPSPEPARGSAGDATLPTVAGPAQPGSSPTITLGGAGGAQGPMVAMDEVPQIADVELQAEIGRGGMGRVWRGRQIYLDRPVAVKLLLIDAQHGGAEYVKRFQREARILSKLAHPHIVGCYQAGVTVGGQPYLVMEFIDGKNLRDWVETNGVLPPNQALTVICDLARALEHAQSNGIIHRDIKPENVLLSSHRATTEIISSEAETRLSSPVLPWVAKLVDLGLARPSAKGSGGSDMHLTLQGVVMGTPATMAPEQFGDPDHVDFRADIYGLGCVLFHALTGKPAFTKSSLGEILTAKVSGPVPDPKRTNAQLPSVVAELVTWMLARDAADRPQSYQQLVSRCEQVLAGDRPRPTAKRPGLAVGMGVAVVLVAALIGVSLLRQHAPPRPSAPAVSVVSTTAMPVVAVAPAGDPKAQVDTVIPPSLSFAAPQPLFGARSDSVLQGWTPMADAHWAGADERVDAINAAKGAITHALPAARCRISGQFSVGSAKVLGVGVLDEHQQGVMIDLKNFGDTIGVATDTGRFSQLGLQDLKSLPMQPVVTVVMTILEKHLFVEVGGMELAPISLPVAPTQLVLNVVEFGDTPAAVAHLTYSLVAGAPAPAP